MAKFKEIEVKWKADKVLRNQFNRLIRFYLKNNGYIYKFINAIGPDTYYVNKHGQTVRHRISKDVHELTSKLRLDKNSITSRKEVNVKLAHNQSTEEVAELLSMVGLQKQFHIVKDCDIYFISGSRAHVSIVWYKVTSSNNPKPKTFIEVEVEGLSQQKSLKVLGTWVERLSKMFELNSRDISKKSLYEIYSGKRYKSVA